MEPHPRRPSAASSCDLHPHDDNSFAGSFCPSCLRDRLAGLDSSSPSASASASAAPGRLSTSALRVRSLFSHRPPSSSSSFAPPPPPPPPPPHPASSSHLRRCRSFSAHASVDVKPMKMHIDLESQSQSRSRRRDSSNFWMRKWQQWRSSGHSHHPHQCTTAAAPPAPPHGIGPRRSCDADPRFSIDDAARTSFDCPPRFSFDGPRASWDGHSSSARPVVSSRFHPLLSAPEGAPGPAAIRRFDDQIPMDDDNSAIPGSQAQTRDYYLDSSSSSRRRRSFERSASLRKTPPLEMETEHRSVPAFNSKVSPAGGAEFYQYHNAVANRDDIDMSGSFTTSAFRDLCKSQVAAEKKQKKWSKRWNLWGLLQRKGSSKDQPANAALASGHADHLLRCNSSVSARSSFSSYSYSAAGSMRRNSVDIININSHANSNGYGYGYGYGCSSNKRRDEFVLERNRSARFSPGRVDNGLLRLYLTPTRGSQSGRRNSGVRPVSTGSQSMSSRPVHRLY